MPINILERIHLNPRLDTTLAQQFKQQLSWFIASGQLKPREFLPSVRQAASQLGINFNTVRNAYQKLEADGLVETRQGSGTRVLPSDLQRVAQLAGELPSHTAGVIVPSLTNPFYHAFLQGVEMVANQARTMLFMCVTHDDPGDARRYYAQLAAKNVDGILLASQDDRPFLSPIPISGERGSALLPLVSADWPASAGYAVSIDLENAGYLATRHLVEHGHRKVGLITHALEFANVEPVNRGYQRALQEAGIDHAPDWIAAVHGFDVTAGSEGARMLLARQQPPTAIFAITDLLAIGAMRAIQQAGWQVPQDLAVAGFNDIPLAALVSPPLTTVSAPAYQMGLEAMKMLQSLIAGKLPSQRQILLPTALVIRQSCGHHTVSNPC